MPRCSVCDAPALASIDRALVVGGVSITALAKRHDLSRQAIYRHQADHLPKALVDAHAEGADGRGAALLAEIEGLKDHVAELLITAKSKGDTRGAVTAIREGTRLIELIGKLRGDLVPAPTVQVNLIQSTEFQVVSARIIAVLAVYPEARAKVLAALGDLG